MKTISKNINLHKAKDAKKDEFYIKFFSVKTLLFHELSRLHLTAKIL